MKSLAQFLYETNPVKDHRSWICNLEANVEYRKWADQIKGIVLEEYVDIHKENKLKTYYMGYQAE